MPPGYRAIVADNGSTDASAAIAAEWGALVVPAAPRGFGAAAHAGLLAATDDVVCFMDADGSLDPRQLPRVAEPVIEGRHDLVLARRLRRAAGVPLHDLGPMRAARRAALEALHLRDRRFGYPLEMVLRAAERGWRIAEVDADYSPRIHGGRSKVTGTVRGTARAVRDMSRVLAS